MREPALRIGLEPDEVIIDNFAGGGGTSEGIKEALGRDPDIAVNHDADALAMHAVNHPETLHIREDVWKVDLTKHVGDRRVGLYWLSPDCKHHSKAKGGKPRDKKIRGLAWVAVRDAKLLRPRVIGLENVEEFGKWGPLLPDGTPCPARMGLTFRRFVKQLENLGYVVEWRELVAADYGAPTTRKRLFLIARCDGLPIVWPKPTHGPGTGQPWRTAAECIDWSLPCPSIFERVRPLAENTNRRIARGIFKYVIHTANPFIVPMQHENRPVGLDEPLQTITTQGNKFNLITPYVAKYHSAKRPGDDRVGALDEALPTQTTENRYGLVAPIIAPVTHSGDERVHRGDEPLRTVTGAHRGEHALIETRLRPGFPSIKPGSNLVYTPFIAGVGGRMGQSPERSVGRPMQTVTSKGDAALIMPLLVGAGGPAYSGKPTAIDKPLGAQTTENHRAVIAPYMVRAAHGEASKDGSKRWGKGEHELGAPVPTVTGSNDFALTVPTLIQTGYGEDKKRNGGRGQAPRVPGLDKPLGTVVNGQKHALVTAFLAKHYGDSGRPGLRGSDLRDPLHTVTACDHNAVVSAFVAKHYGGHETPGSSLELPLDTVTEKDHNALVASSLIKYKGTARDGQPMTVPMHTIQAGGNRAGVHYAEVRAFLMKYHATGGQLNSLFDPAPTVLANDSIGIVTVNGEEYRIADIGMRMLQPRELFRAQGFPDSYIIDRDVNGRVLTKTAQVRMCGNSVCPPLAAAIVRAQFEIQVVEVAA